MKDLLLTLRTFENIGNIEKLKTNVNTTTGILHLKNYSINFYISYDEKCEHMQKEHFYISLKYNDLTSELTTSNSYFNDIKKLNVHSLFISEINKFTKLLKYYKEID